MRCAVAEIPPEAVTAAMEALKHPEDDPTPGYTEALERGCRLSLEAAAPLILADAAAWVVAFGACVAAVARPKRALLWLSVAGIPCNAALIVTHL